MTCQYSSAFFAALEQLIGESRVIIDRPRGSAHPKYPTVIYPLDYGYLDNTSSMDGSGIDLWRGSLPEATLGGIIVTVDLLKRDSEIKLVLGCTEEEVSAVLAFHNQSDYMKGTWFPREIEKRPVI